MLDPLFDQWEVKNVQGFEWPNIFLKISEIPENYNLINGDETGDSPNIRLKLTSEYGFWTS